MRTVLTIAGSDPSGGAGIQGDLKTLAAHGVYGMAVITAITVQNTHGVSRVEPLTADLVLDQISGLLSDIEPDAIKIGMLATEAIVRAVARALTEYRRPFAAPAPIVLDPVLAATHGRALLEPDGLSAVRETLLPLVSVVTPNASEATALTDLPVRTVAEAREAAERLVALGAASALVTGGHLDGPPIDVLFTGARVIELEGARIESADTHGTGCAFASALAANLALGEPLEESARRAKAFVAEAIRRAPRLGHGRGPIGH